MRHELPRGTFHLTRRKQCYVHPQIRIDRGSQSQLHLCKRYMILFSHIQIGK